MTRVLVTDDGPVQTITLNAPDRLNALDLDLLADLRTAIAETAATDTVGAVVVTGAGRGFGAGADLTGMFGDLDRPRENIRDHLRGGYASFLGLRALPVPALAALKSATIGAGLMDGAIIDGATEADFEESIAAEAWAQAESPRDETFRAYLADFAEKRPTEDASS